MPSNIQKQNVLYGLIGYPLGHSFSKPFFDNILSNENIDGIYENFPISELTAEALYKFILLNPNLKGFNVTAPYKEQIIQFLDKVEPVAAKIGAVNTVRLNRDSFGRITTLEGFNTDIEGFRESIRPLIQHLHSDQRKAIILGTGGASFAVEEALHQLNFDTLKVSRSGKNGATRYCDLSKDVIQSYRVIVNATPVGTAPNIDEAPDIPYEHLSENHIVHDLVYNPAQTLFMQKAHAMGATVKNGLDMLHRQALASRRIWDRND